MAEGLASATAVNILNAMLNGASWSSPAVHVQLHIGPPGAAGTANPAADARRVAASFALAQGPTVANDAALTWSNITGAQDPTYFSAWSAASGGVFLFSGALDSAPFAAGNTLTVPAGALVVSFPVAS